MSSETGDRLHITVESDDDNEREDYAPGEGSEDDDTSRYKTGYQDETVTFPNMQKKKKKVFVKLTRKEQSLKRSLKQFKKTHALVKPDITTDRDKERMLRRIATKGVVQLFNAVADRQKTMTDAVKEKMTARERRQARETFDGKNFDVNKFGGDRVVSTKRELKNEDDEENMSFDEGQIDTGNYSDDDQ